MLNSHLGQSVETAFNWNSEPDLVLHCHLVPRVLGTGECTARPLGGGGTTEAVKWGFTGGNGLGQVLPSSMPSSGTGLV